MSENWYVVHTQPRGEKMLKALLDREPAVADTYLPMRQQFAIVGGQRVSRMALTMPGLVCAATRTSLWRCCAKRVARRV